MALTTVQSAMIGGGTGSSAFAPSTPIYENTQTLTSNYTVTTGSNAFTAGPFTVATGVTLTIPTSSRFVIV
jgi:hypothetical protein